MIKCIIRFLFEVGILVL